MRMNIKWCDEFGTSNQVTFMKCWSKHLPTPLFKHKTSHNVSPVSHNTETKDSVSHTEPINRLIIDRLNKTHAIIMIQCEQILLPRNPQI